MLAFQALVVALAIAKVRPLAVCTGASTNLPADQCAAWQAFWDGAGGDDWQDYNNKPLSCSRTDPCSCKGADGTHPMCTPDGTSVMTMYVIPAPRLFALRTFLLRLRSMLDGHAPVLLGPV